jgi:Ca2+-binding EF-hand superfamily protein
MAFPDRLVTMSQIKELHRHFKNISSQVDDDGLIDKKEFQQALGLSV